MDITNFVSWTLAGLGIALTVWFGVRSVRERISMTKKRKIKQKQAQRGQGVMVETQQAVNQKQALRGSGVQAQTLELEEEEESVP